MLALYRYSLYNGQAGYNHTNDFQEIYTLDGWIVPLGVVSVVLLWRYGRLLRGSALFVVTANLLGALAFFLMHRMGILVTYQEFIEQHMGGGR